MQRCTRAMLLVIFTNDLAEHMIFHFVDDTKIFRNIKEFDDQSILKDDVNSIMKWTDY